MAKTTTSAALTWLGTKTLPAAPVAAHVGYDHGAARTKFLHVVRVANAHRIRPGIVAGIDVIRPGVRIDPNPRPGPSLRRHVRRSRMADDLPGWLGQPAPGRRGFRLRCKGQQHRPAQARQKCCYRHPDHRAHPNSLCQPTVTVFASRVNYAKTGINSNRRRRGTRARLIPCGQA